MFLLASCFSRLWLPAVRTYAGTTGCLLSTSGRLRFRILSQSMHIMAAHGRVALPRIASPAP